MTSSLARDLMYVIAVMPKKVIFCLMSMLNQNQSKKDEEQLKEQLLVKISQKSFVVTAMNLWWSLANFKTVPFTTQALIQTNMKTLGKDVVHLAHHSTGETCNIFGNMQSYAEICNRKYAEI